MILNFLSLLPHGVILVCNMYIVFFLIDRVNTAMCFIDNDITKGLLAVMCLLSMGISVALIRAQRKADAGEARREQKMRSMKRRKALNAAKQETHTLKKAA